MKTKVTALAFTAMLFASANAEVPQTNDPAELKKIIAQQEKQIKDLQAKLADLEPASGNKSTTENKLIKNKFEYHKE